MNCANHPGVENVAFCRTCGKPLCANCSRPVSGVIYCEQCLAEKLGIAGVPSPPPAASQTTPQPTPLGPSGPNPALAGILGAIPFGIGAVYTGQYAKALAHLLIFVFLVWGLSSGTMGNFEPVLGVGMAFFVIYQIIDAIRSARAMQLGQPAPDPFGLGQTFSAGEKIDTSKVPTAAIVLIGLGVLFLLQTSGIFGFGFDRLWPFILIGLGVWLFARRQGMVGSGYNRYGRSYRKGSLVGPAILVTVGTLKLIENMHGPDWDRTWPVLLLVIGLTKLFENRVPFLGGNPPPASGPTASVSGEVQPPAPSSEVRNG